MKIVVVVFAPVIVLAVLENVGMLKVIASLMSIDLNSSGHHHWCLDENKSIVYNTLKGLNGLESSLSRRSFYGQLQDQRHPLRRCSSWSSFGVHEHSSSVTLYS